MSHVVNIDFSITDLPALETACAALGLELMRGQSSFRWYGTHVGDYPLPKGFKAEDMGKCEHAVRVKGKPAAYEVGLVRRRDGKPGWSLMYDFIAGGFGLEAAVGSNCSKLRVEYTAAVTTAQAARMGMRVQRESQPDGSTRMTLQR